MREKGIACEEVVVDLPGGALREPAFRRLNPFGQVPVLEDGEVIIYESLAILEYLEERHPSPPLLPADPAGRAQARQLMLASGDYLAPPFKRWLARLFTPREQWDVADQERAREEIGAHLDVLAGVLGDHAYLLGDMLTLADVAYAPLVCEMGAVQLDEVLAARPAVAAWVERLRGRPAVRSTGLSA